MKRLIYLSVVIALLIGLLSAAAAAQLPNAANQPGSTYNVSADYIWSQTSGTYTEITGGTQVTTSCDNQSYNNYTLPFSFTYNGVAYSAISIQCNGFIAMGESVSSSYSPIGGGASNNVISALGLDLWGTATDSAIRMETLGSEPDRVVVVQWKHFARYYQNDENYNFQIRLYEGRNLVQVVYGPFSGAKGWLTEVGLRGASNADFNNRTSSFGWTNTQPGTVANATILLNSSYMPPLGLTWTWTPFPHQPIFDTSTKTATAEVAAGGDITYVMRIENSGTGSSDSATLIDPIPAGVTYNGDVACSDGTCGFDGTNVTWSGTVAIDATVAVTYSVNTAALSCGDMVVNQATLDDPGLVGDPVVLSAETLLTGMVADLLTQGFEGGVPPGGWTVTMVADPGNEAYWLVEDAGLFPTLSPHSGGAMAYFNSDWASPGAMSRLATNALDLSTGASPQLYFYMSHDAAGGDDVLQIQASTDGGSTWVNVGSPIPRYDAAYTTPGWGLHRVSLAAYAGQSSVKVGFLGISGKGNNIFLDDVTIRQMCVFPIRIWPDQTGTTCPGTSKEYTLSVLNNTLVTDTIDVTLSGNAWPATVSPTSLSLAPGQTSQVTVTAVVTPSAVAGETDTTIATITAQGSGAVHSAAITTTAFGPGVASAWEDRATGAEPDLYWGHSYYYDGDVCVVGGLAGQPSPTTTGEHWCYNIASATWTARAPLPIPVWGGAYGLIGAKFYIAGGFPSSCPSAGLQIYDIATDSWSTGAPPPSNRFGQASGVVGGKLYSAGGGIASDYPTDCPTYEYDPVADAWTTLADCPLQGGYGFCKGGSVGSDFHGLLFAGGRFPTSTGWYAFDPVANTWQTLANLPVPMTPLIVENPKTGRVYSIGGLNNWSAQNGTWEYNYSTDTWSNLNLPQHATTGGSLGPAHGSFGDPDLAAFWTEGGTRGNGALLPAPLEAWLFDCSEDTWTVYLPLLAVGAG